MKQATTKTTIYEFDDMKIIVIKEINAESTAVFVEVASNLEFVFGVMTKDADDLDIEALHENGYFSEYSYKDKAVRFMEGETI